MLSILQPAVAEAYKPAFWDNFWPEYVTVGAEGVKVFVGYSLPSEPIREARSGNADLAVRQTQPWLEGSRPVSRPFQVNLTAWLAEGDPSTLAPVKVTASDAALLPIVAHCFMPAPKQPSSMDGRELLALELRWRKGQTQPFAIDVGALRTPVTEERKSAILACMQAAMAGQRGFAGPARLLRLQNRPQQPVQRTCLTAPPENGVSEIIALTPHSNPPDLTLDDSSPSRSAAWKERRACLESKMSEPSPPVWSVTQTFVPVASASAISQDFKPSMDQATTSVGECFKRVDLPDGETSVHASWPIGVGGRLSAGRLTSEERLPSNSIRCLRRAIERLSLPPVPQTTGTFRLEFRVFTRTRSSSSPYPGDVGLPGPPPDWALERMRKRPPRDSLLLVLPYALIATPLPVLPVEPPPPPPPAAPTRVGSGRPPPESFGFTPPARAELDAVQRCLDRCVANNRWSEIGSKALSSAVVEVYPWCDEPPELGTIDCVPSSLAELGPSCAKQCLRQALVERRLYLGAHPDDVVQPEPPPLLALVFDGAVGIRWIPQEMAKLVVAAQPAVQHCFLDAAEEEAVPDWVNLRIKFEVDGRVASVTGWEGRGSDELIGCLARVAAKWAAPNPLNAFSEPSQSLMLISLRRDPRAVGVAGWEMGVRRGIRFESLDPLESSTSARLLAGFKRYTFGLVGLEEHSSAILRASFALLPAFMLFRAFRRRRRAVSQSD